MVQESFQPEDLNISTGKGRHWHDRLIDEGLMPRIEQNALQNGLPARTIDRISRTIRNELIKEGVSPNKAGKKATALTQQVIGYMKAQPIVHETPMVASSDSVEQTSGSFASEEPEDPTDPREEWYVDFISKVPEDKRKYFGDVLQRNGHGAHIRMNDYLRHLVMEYVIRPGETDDLPDGPEKEEYIQVGVQAIMSLLKDKYQPNFDHDIETGEPLVDTKGVEAPEPPEATPEPPITTPTMTHEQPRPSNPENSETTFSREDIKRLIDERVTAETAKMKAEFAAQMSQMRAGYEEQIANLKAELRAAKSQDQKTPPVGNPADHLKNGFRNAAAASAAARSRFQDTNAGGVKEGNPSVQESKQKVQDFVQPQDRQPHQDRETIEPTAEQVKEIFEPDKKEETQEEKREKKSWGLKFSESAKARIKKVAVTAAVVGGIWGMIAYGDHIAELGEKRWAQAKDKFGDFLNSNEGRTVQASDETLWKLRAEGQPIPQPSPELTTSGFDDEESDHDRMVERYKNFPGKTHAEKMKNYQGQEKARNKVLRAQGIKPTPNQPLSKPMVGREPGRPARMDGGRQGDAYHQRHTGSAPHVRPTRHQALASEAQNVANAAAHFGLTEYSGNIAGDPQPNLTWSEFQRQRNESSQSELDQQRMGVERVEITPENTTDHLKPKIEVKENSTIQTAKELLEKVLTLESKRKALDAKDSNHLVQNKELIRQELMIMDQLKLGSLSAQEKAGGKNDAFGELEDSSLIALDHEYRDAFAQFKGIDLWTSLDNLRANLVTQELLNNIVE